MTQRSSRMLAEFVGLRRLLTTHVYPRSLTWAKTATGVQADAAALSIWFSTIATAALGVPSGLRPAAERRIRVKFATASSEESAGEPVANSWALWQHSGAQTAPIACPSSGTWPAIAAFEAVWAT